MAKELTPAEFKRATERVEDAFLATGRTLERLTKQRGVAPMLRLIEQAHADLERKVRNLGKPGETFTEVQRQALLAQYRAMLVQLQPRMVRTLGEASREAQIAGIRDLVKLVALGEAEFEGVVTPLPLEQAARMAGIIDADRASLLRQHEVSIRTYGIQSIGEAETFLAQSFMQAKGYAETTSGLLSMVEGSRYRAERIVRTETSFAYNTAHATAIDDAAEIVDGLMRRWTEYVDDATGRPLDARVANDSLVLHGQVCFQPEGATFEGRSTFLVGGTGGFTMPPDGRVNAKLWGRRYAHPPNRPNDRSRLVPWKPTWGVPAYMVVNGVRMDVRKALALMKGAEADEVLDVAEGEAIPEQKLASEEAVDASRAAFRREQERRNAEARAKRGKSTAGSKSEKPQRAPKSFARTQERRALPEPRPSAEVTTVRGNGADYVAKNYPELAKMGTVLRVDRIGTAKQQEIVDDLVHEMSHVPSELIAKVKEKGLREVHIGIGAMPDLDDLSSYSGVQPRGWSPGQTWDIVPGAYENRTKAVVAGATGRHGSSSVILHEFGHSVGDLLNAENSVEFYELHARGISSNQIYKKYYKQEGIAGRQEWFAETFAQYLTSASSEDFVNKIAVDDIKWAREVASHFERVTGVKPSFRRRRQAP